MNTEQFSRAMQIKNEIDALREHKDNVSLVLKRDKSFLTLDTEYSNYSVRLKNDFLPSPLPKSFDIYIYLIDKKIEELETEFNNL